MSRPPYFDNSDDYGWWWEYRTSVCGKETWTVDKYLYDGYFSWRDSDSHEIFLLPGLHYFCRHCRLMGSRQTFKDYPCMSVIEFDAKKKEPETEKLKLQVYSGGKDGEGDWLSGLKVKSVFTCRRKDDKDYMLIQFHLMNRWGNNTVYLMSNFPNHQTGEALVHSLRFSQLHDLVDIIQDGDRNMMPKELETTTLNERFGVDDN